MNADRNDRMPPPLSPSLDALLAHERLVPEQAEIVRARAIKRARDSLQRAAAERHVLGPLSIHQRRWFFSAVALLTLLAGGAAAVQMMRRSELRAAVEKRHTPAVSAGAVNPTARVLALQSSARPEPANVATTAPASPSVAERSAARSAVSAERHSNATAELDLLSRARQSDARAEYASVLATVAEHERSYPAGRLAEEREVLRIKALVGLGRANEARQFGAKFRRQFPRSVLLQRVDGMLASLP